MRSNTPATTSASRCAAAVRGKEVFYEVSDNGPGIAPGEQRRIFERFYQSDQRLSRSHEGVGLGPEHRARDGEGAPGNGVGAERAGGGEHVCRPPSFAAQMSVPKVLQIPLSSCHLPPASLLDPPRMETVLIIEDDAAALARLEG